jgi:hypothetical protein
MDCGPPATRNRHELKRAISQGLRAPCRSYCSDSGSEGVYSRLSACSRTFLPSGPGRSAGMLPRTCREGRSPYCSYRGLRRRQSRTGTCFADYRRRRLGRRESCWSCCAVAGYRPDSFGRAMRRVRMPIPFSLARKSRNSCIPTSKPPTQDNRWLRPSRLAFPACLLSAFTLVTTKYCSTIRADMLTVPLLPESMPGSICGGGCRTGSLAASET